MRTQVSRGSEPIPAIAAALETVRVAERAVSLPAEESEFRLATRTAYQPGVDGALLEGLADPLVQRVLAKPAPGRLIAACRSAVVVTGKFCQPDQVKARAYLLDGAAPLTLKVWRTAPGERDLGRQEREIRATVSGIPEYRSPGVFQSGRQDGVDFLLEGVVYGRHPAPGAERTTAALELVPALVEAYRRRGVTQRRLSRIVHRDFPALLSDVLGASELVWDPAWGSRRQLVRRLDRLIRANRALPCSLGHGDLVASNIIRTAPGRHVLIDWEFARVIPVGFDLGKLLVASGDPEGVFDQIEQALRRFDGRGLLRYRWRDQVALGIAQLVSWDAKRRMRARAAGLTHCYDRELTMRLRWLAALLAD